MNPGGAAIDVHAHLLPRKCYEIPRATGLLKVEAREGGLWSGDVPMYVSERDLSDPQAATEDMDRTGLTKRVLSPPPMAFLPDDVRGAAEYARTFNSELAAACADSRGRLVGLGTIPLGDIDLATQAIEEIAGGGELRGVAIPPMIGSWTLDSEPFSTVLEAITDAGLCVLVHPVQTPRPGLENHYLSNLLGNPYETAVAAGGLILGGVLERLPDLRICFMHGAGCTPAVLGRWDHGWRARPEPSKSSRSLPSEAFRSVYADTLTHGSSQLALLTAVASPERIVLGSDYPFDMGDSDCVQGAACAGLDLRRLTRNAERFLYGDQGFEPLLIAQS